MDVQVLHASWMSSTEAGSEDRKRHHNPTPRKQAAADSCEAQEQRRGNPRRQGVEVMALGGTESRGQRKSEKASKEQGIWPGCRRMSKSLPGRQEQVEVGEAL